MRVLVALLVCYAALAAAGLSLGADGVVPTPIGVGPRFHPPALSPAVAAARPVAGLRCARNADRRTGVHLELFAHNRVVIIPRGIGVAPPWHLAGPYVDRGACSYAARTRKPTGVIEIARGSALTLGDFFALWGQPLSRTRLGGFRTDRARPVRAYVGGTRWRGPLDAIPLRRHAQIVLELGRFVPPHLTYRFEGGLE